MGTDAEVADGPKYGTRIFCVGDESPFSLNLPITTVAARIRDAEAMADSAGLPGRGWARFKGRAGPVLIRTGAISSLVSYEVEED